MNSIVDDAPICLYVSGSGDWCPDNYDPEFTRPDHADRRR